jgi:hypothetical protein
VLSSCHVVQGVSGNLGVYPPENSTDLIKGKLWNYLGSVGKVMKWNPFKVSPLTSPLPSVDPFPHI